MSRANVVETSGPPWSIDGLAALTGVPSRTIREYKTLGLLPAPARAGRVGMYGPEHRERLELVGRLQARGYSLAGIKDLLAAWQHGRSLAELVGAGPFDEAPTSFTGAQLAQRLPALAEPGALAGAEAAGLIQRDRDGRWVVRSDALLTLVADLIDVGVSVTSALDAVAALRAQTRDQANLLAELFVAGVWREHDFEAALAFALRARPLISQAVASLVADALGSALLRIASLGNDPALTDLVAKLRVGVIHEVPEEERP